MFVLGGVGVCFGRRRCLFWAAVVFLLGGGGVYFGRRWCFIYAAVVFLLCGGGVSFVRRYLGRLVFLDRLVFLRPILERPPHLVSPLTFCFPRSLQARPKARPGDVIKKCVPPKKLAFRARFLRAICLKWAFIDALYQAFCFWDSIFFIYCNKVIEQALSVLDIYIVHAVVK